MGLQLLGIASARAALVPFNSKCTELEKISAQDKPCSIIIVRQEEVDGIKSFACRLARSSSCSKAMVGAGAHEEQSQAVQTSV
jgi:hypothetical protein